MAGNEGKVRFAFILDFKIIDICSNLCISIQLREWHSRKCRKITSLTGVSYTISIYFSSSNSCSKMKVEDFKKFLTKVAEFKKMSAARHHREEMKEKVEMLMEMKHEMEEMKVR